MGKGGALFFMVDPQLEGDTSSELVPLTKGVGKGVGADLALDTDVSIEGDVLELYCNQGLGVVHLVHRGQRKTERE